MIDEQGRPVLEEVSEFLPAPVNLARVRNDREQKPPDRKTKTLQSSLELQTNPPTSRMDYHLNREIIQAFGDSNVIVKNQIGKEVMIWKVKKTRGYKLFQTS
jgi:hypothetical protein